MFGRRYYEKEEMVLVVAVVADPAGIRLYLLVHGFLWLRAFNCRFRLGWGMLSIPRSFCARFSAHHDYPIYCILSRISTIHTCTTLNQRLSIAKHAPAVVRVLCRNLLQGGLCYSGRFLGGGRQLNSKRRYFLGLMGSVDYWPLANNFTRHLGVSRYQ